ncbi:MAG: Holliday junction branch migration protein RuvA, partial [Alistipes sp.]|nr:Holliday junction branch migration protein RuvA [Alistipes sp.]
MFEYIKGELVEVAPAYAVVEAAGVGYFLNISLTTYSEIEKQSATKLFAHHIVREDVEMLYGFATREERDLFRLLISVSGVGGNTARMILSTYSPTELRNIIATGNAVLLKNVKGLGLKTAQKIIVDLSGKMLDLPKYDAAAAALSVAQTPEAYDEALSALIMLGFAKTASEKVLR